MTGWRLLVVGLTGLAAALRLPGLFHDFWFDEVWSLALVREFVSTPADILLRLHVDNNHPLNSLVLFLLGERTMWWIYRVPALVCGVASVPLAGLVMTRFGRATAVAAMLLVACSYPLIVYASEARGYAPMVLCTLAAIWSHQQWAATSSFAVRATFWLAVILGVLSHVTFVHAYGALLVWSVLEVRRRGLGWHEALAVLGARHSVPLAAVAVIDHVFIGRLQVAGADPAPLLSVLTETIALAVGMPGHGAWGWVAVAAFGLVLGLGLRAAWRHEPAWVAFAVCGILVVPAVTVVREFATSPLTPRLFPRYFLVGHVLFLLVAAVLIGSLWQAGARRRVLAVGLTLLFAVGHLSLAATFARGGRGRYLAAVQRMATTSPLVRVSSTSDTRTGVLLAFYARYLPPGSRMVFLPRTSARAGEADWRIREDLDAATAVPSEIVDERGGRFRLAASYGYAGLSGCQWSLYARVPPSVVPGTSGEPARPSTP